VRPHCPEGLVPQRAPFCFAATHLQLCPEFCIDFRSTCPRGSGRCTFSDIRSLLSSALHSFLQTAQYSFHNNPKYWAEPERFRPERLLTESGSRAAAFAPFGNGGRQCVGMRFVKAASKVNTRPMHNPPQCVTRDQLPRERWTWSAHPDWPCTITFDNVYAYCCRSRSSGFSRGLPWGWSRDRRHCS